MRSKVLIALLIVCLLAVVGFYGYQMGQSKAAADEAANLEEIRRRSEAAARAFHQGIEDAGREQAEKNRVMQEQDDARKRAENANTQRMLIDYHDRFDCERDPDCQKALEQLPEDQRQAFAREMNEWNRERARELAKE